MKLLLFILLSSCLGSCQSVVKTIYGAHRPVVQTPESISWWLHREALRPQHIAAVRPEAFYKIFMSYADGLKVFSADGRLLPLGYRKGKFCPHGLDEALASLKPPAPRPEAPSAPFDLVAVPGVRQFRLAALFSGLRTLQGEVIPAGAKGVDFIVIIPFALWMGRRFQTKDMRSFVRAISQNSSFSYGALWMLLMTTTGFYFGWAIIDQQVRWYNIVFYLLFIVTLTLLLRLLYRKWKI